MHAHMAWSQKFRKWEISLDTGDSASNAVAKLSVLSVFSDQRCAEHVCVCTMDCVSAGKNTLLLYVTVCEKVVPRLNKHDDVIKWNFMKTAPSRNEELVAPLPCSKNGSYQDETDPIRHCVILSMPFCCVLKHTSLFLSYTLKTTVPFQTKCMVIGRTIKHQCRCVLFESSFYLGVTSHVSYIWACEVGHQVLTPTTK